MVLLLASLSFHDLYSQIKEVVATDHDYIIPKFPYGKTKKFERIYCNMYHDKFNCRNIGSTDSSMFPAEFNLADEFFIKLSLRPVGKENYNALNIAGLYLRKKRPGKNDTTFEYTFLDIELESLIDRIYFRNDELTSVHEDEVQFKLACLKLIEENLFLITERIYDNELYACNNFEGPYYEASRKFFIDALYRLWKMEKNIEIQKEIRKLLFRIPEKYK